MVLDFPMKLSGSMLNRSGAPNMVFCGAMWMWSSFEVVIEWGDKWYDPCGLRTPTMEAVETAFY